MSTTELETTTTESDDDIKEYRIRIGVTVRAFAEETFEAESWDAAVAKARAYKPSEFLYSYDTDQGFEGDEIGYLREADDCEADDHEVDLRDEGEPYSWAAVDIVKDLAKLTGIEGGLDTIPALKALGKLVERARAACKKEETDGNR